MAATTNLPALEIIRDGRRASSLLRGSRQEILQHLSQPDSASGLARKMGLPRQRLNYHLRGLERDGLVELVEERRRGNCVERIVRASARAFVVSPEAFGGLAAGTEKEMDRASAAYQVATAARVLRQVGELDAEARLAGRRLVTMTLDSQIRFADSRSRSSFAAELADALARLLVKFHDPEAADGLTYRLTTLLHPVPGPPPPAAPLAPVAR